MCVYIGKNIEGGDAMLLNDHEIQLLYWKKIPISTLNNMGPLTLRQKLWQPAGSQKEPFIPQTTSRHLNLGRKSDISEFSHRE